MSRTGQKVRVQDGTGGGIGGGRVGQTTHIMTGVGSGVGKPVSRHAQTVHIRAMAGIFDDFERPDRLPTDPEVLAGWGTASCRVYGWDTWWGVWGDNPDWYTIAGVENGEGYLHPEPMFGYNSSGRGWAAMSPVVVDPQGVDPTWQHDPDYPAEVGDSMIVRQPFAVKFKFRATDVNPTEFEHPWPSTAAYSYPLPPEWVAYNAAIDWNDPDGPGYQSTMLGFWLGNGALYLDFYPAMGVDLYSTCDDPDPESYDRNGPWHREINQGLDIITNHDPAIGWWITVECSPDPAWANEIYNGVDTFGDPTMAEQAAAVGAGSVRVKMWPADEEEPTSGGLYGNGYTYIWYLDSRCFPDPEYPEYPPMFDSWGFRSLQTEFQWPWPGAIYPDQLPPDWPDCWVDYGTKLWIDDVRVWQGNSPWAGLATGQREIR